MKPYGVELFAGCGGLSTGFLDAGLHVGYALELDRRAVDAYNYNHEYRGARAVVQDISKLSGQELLDGAGVDVVDFLIGGPPCQPFSIAGKRLGEQDARSDLMHQFVRLSKELAPKAILIENVPNLASLNSGSLLGNVVRQLRDLDYAIRFGVVSAADYGVPQFRKRLFVLGFHNGPDPVFPAMTHGLLDAPHITVSQAIGDLPDAGEDIDYVFNHEPTMHSEEMLARFSILEPGKRERGSYHDRLKPNSPSYTIRAGSGNYTPLRPVHFSKNRVITVRESARLQGFHDSFIWPDSIPRLQQYRQVGNAVPPPLAKAFAISIAHQLGWMLEPELYEGNPESRVPPITKSYEERASKRQSLLRGASLGKKARSSL